MQRPSFNLPAAAAVAVVLLVAISFSGQADSWVFWSFKVMVRNDLGPGSRLHIRCSKMAYNSAYVSAWVPIREMVVTDKQTVVIGRLHWYNYADFQLSCRYFVNRRGQQCSWTVFMYNTTNDLLDGLDRLWSVRPAGLFEKDPTEISGYAFRYHHCKEFKLKDLVLR